MFRTFQGVVRVALVLVLAFVAASAVPPPVAHAAMFCSCPDCPDPIEVSAALVVGHVTGWETVKDAAGNDVVQLLGAEQRVKPVKVHIEVSESFRRSVGQQITVEDRLYQRNSGEYSWQPQGSIPCVGFRGEDPTGWDVVVAVGYPGVDFGWVRLAGPSGGFVSFRAAVAQRGLVPLPPSAGSGLATGGRRPPLFRAGEAFLLLSLLFTAPTVTTGVRRHGAARFRVGSPRTGVHPPPGPQGGRRR